MAESITSMVLGAVMIVLLVSVPLCGGMLAMYIVFLYQQVLQGRGWWALGAFWRSDTPKNTLLMGGALLIGVLATLMHLESLLLGVLEWLVPQLESSIIGFLD